MDNFNINYGRNYSNNFNQDDLRSQINRLHQDVQTLSTSLLNLYNLEQSTNSTVINIENMLYRNRYSNPIRSQT